MAPSTSAATLNEAFRATVAAAPDRVAVRTLDDAVSLTWAELARRVDALAGGLARLGVRRGDTVALMIGNRPEFHLADLAVMTLGATPFSLYQTLSPEQIAYVVGDAGARLAIAERALLPNLLAARRELPALKRRRPHRRRRRRHASRSARSRARIPGSTPRRRGARSRPTTS